MKRLSSLLLHCAAFTCLLFPNMLIGNTQSASYTTLERKSPLLVLPEYETNNPLIHRCSSVFEEQIPTYYPISFHWIISVSVIGDSLVIEDGSVWELDPSDGKKVLQWVRSNEKVYITITQNDSWWSSYYFRIVKYGTEESILANFKLPPFKNNPYFNAIARVDQRQKTVTLTNKMNLFLCPQDESLFTSWYEGQGIIIGANSGWQSGTYDLILINVAKRNFVRAKQF